jgi:hypothetical protein
MAGMSATDSIAIDDVDFQTLAFILSYLEAHGYSPHWSELRSHLGYRLSGQDWWETVRANRGPYKEQWKAWRSGHQDLGKRRAQRAFNKETYAQWVAKNDPIPGLLSGLRDRGLVDFSAAERSLDVSAAGRAVLAARGEPEAAEDSVTWGRIKPGAPIHAFRQQPDGRWTPACRRIQSFKEADLASLGDTPGGKVCGHVRCQDWATRPMDPR